MSHLIVWRSKEGNALRTYGTDNAKELLTFDEEEQKAREVDAEELERLVASHEPFEKVAVPTDAARSVLGWDVE